MAANTRMVDQPPGAAVPGPRGIPQTHLPTLGSVTQALTQADVDEMIRKALEAQLATMAAAQAPTPAPATPEEVAKWAGEHFGYMAAYLNDPEIGPILKQAAKDQVTSTDVLFGRLYNTNWWKTTADQARTWDFTRRTDPATAQDMLEEKAATIHNRAASLGINLGGDLSAFAEQSIRMGWTDEQIADYLIQRVKSQTSFTAGDLGANQASVKKMAAQYLIPLSDASAAEYARRMASGELSLPGVASTFQASAKSRFDWLAPQIDQGVTPADYFLPMRDRLAQVLELNPEDVNPLDGKWLGLMEVTDPKSGKKRGATDTEVIQAAKRDPRWKLTNNYTNSVTDAFSVLAKTWGVKA